MNANLSNIKSILLACLLMMAMPLMAQQPQRNSSVFDIQLRKLVYAQGAIVQLYVDTVNIPKLTEDAIRGMLTELDPHSTYSSAKDVQALNEPITGSFEGIGVQLNMNEDLHSFPTRRASDLDLPSSSFSPSVAVLPKRWASLPAT